MHPPAILIRHRRPLIVLLHLVLIPLGYFVTYVLRFGLPIPPDYLAVMWQTLPILIVFTMIAFGVFGLFQGWWRHVGMQDLIDLVKAISVSSVAFLSFLFLTGDLDQLPRSIYALNWLVALGVFGGARICVRIVREGRLSLRGGGSGVPALIIGAGNAGERLARELQRTPNGIRPVAFVDDDPAKQGTRIHGVPVLGGTAELKLLVEGTGAGLIVIAMPSARRSELQLIVDRCLETGIEFCIVPSLRELLDGQARLGELRKVELEDLLGREPVELDLQAVRQQVQGRRVLITGAAGSIGSELARQIGRLRPKALVLVEQAESPLYFVDLELRRAHPTLRIVPVVGDIMDDRGMDRVFAEHRPEYVFHAAAYKHVPLMEANVDEAVRNNVFGTLTVAKCAARHGTRCFVLISTDKAVKPSSIMGATKRIAERIVLGWPDFEQRSTDFRAVRFGNVLGSDGSVVPLFKRQLAAGEPLTVTHPDVTRYFMTIPEAVQLVLRASVLHEATGRISMLEMGEPVKIITLAENLIRLSGLEPHRDVRIVFTGMRPGEKLAEQLMSESEATVATEVEKIRIVQSNEVDGKAIQEAMDRLAAELELGDRDGLLDAIRSLVPECTLRCPKVDRQPISTSRADAVPPRGPL
jgi:FlaA1/EpsC-like NDP-sugar epimerase